MNTTSAALVRIHAVSPWRATFVVRLDSLLAVVGAPDVFVGGTSTLIDAAVADVSAALAGAPVGVSCANALHARSNAMAANVARN